MRALCRCPGFSLSSGVADVFRCVSTPLSGADRSLMVMSALVSVSPGLIAGQPVTSIGPRSTHGVRDFGWWTHGRASNFRVDA